MPNNRELVDSAPGPAPMLQQSSTDDEAGRRAADRPARPTARAILCGLLLIPPNAWWFAHIEYVRYSDNCTTSALFFNTITLLMVLLGVNGLVARLWPRKAFSRTELLTVYVMLVVASALTGHDQLQILFTTITWVFRNATPENGWADEIWPHLPQHLVVSDPAALNPLYLGGSSLYEGGHWRPWLAPLAWWALFAMVLVWTLLCLMSILRRQWERERLNYPIAGVPLELTAPDRALYHSWPFWTAFALAGGMELVRLGHSLWPAVPALNIGVYNYTFKGLPLSAAGAIPISSYPFSYGLAYLLPLQLSFSVWFFFWFARLELIGTALMGYKQFNRFPFVQQQGVGAYFGIALFVLWAARHHLGRVLREAVGVRATRSDKAAWAGVVGDGVKADPSQEPLSSAVAVWGFVAGVSFMVAFAVAAGMAWGSALCFLLLFLTVTLTVTRIRAELGLPTIEMYQVGAEDIMQNVAGTASWSKKDLSVITLFFWLTRTHRQLPMPIHGDSLRIADQSGLSMRGLTAVILLASAVAIVTAFWAFLHVTYQVGYESAKFNATLKWAFGLDPWRKLDSWLANPRKPDWGASCAYLYGVGFTLLLAALRTRFVWWPFHPAGYLVSGSFGLFRLWLPIFLTWLIKSLLLRYGGLSAYRKARPFFLGLIVGEFAVGYLRTLLDLAFSLYLPATSGIGGL